jgi:transcriptional antiterminator RfaH
MKSLSSNPSETASSAQPDRLEWFCVKTKPQRERFAMEHLERQGIETFLPLARHRRIAGSNVNWRISPLFARYLFFRFDPGASFTPVRSTRGVTSIVAFGERPAAVPNDVIEEIRRRAKDDIIEFEEPEINEGAPVRILGGPYEGMEAIFARKTSDQDRVIVLLEIMASIAHVSLDRNLLELC